MLETRPPLDFDFELPPGKYVTGRCPVMLFRYPGGKGKLVKSFINQLTPANVYAEPFVGGGSVAITVADRYPKCKLYLNDIDFWVASFWQVVSDKDYTPFQELLRRVSKKPTITQFKEMRTAFQPADFSMRRQASYIDAAYCALFFNRTTFSGIFRSGPIGGNFQTNKKYDVACRWTPKHIQRDLEHARALLLGRTIVKSLDWKSFVEQLPQDSFLYLDPPYVKAGNALYGSPWSLDDHKTLAGFLKARRNWFLSYDNNPFVVDLYSPFSNVKDVAHFRSMPAQHKRHKDASELFITPKELYA
jgi:DNA adenine methylase